MTWIMTGTGRKIDFLNPDADQITLIDICIALSRNHRFGGHSPLKVAQHLLEVMTLMLDKALKENPQISVLELAEIALVALLHDFPEYAVGDIPTPLKRLLGTQFAEIEDRLLGVMLEKWNLTEAYEKHNALLKWADAVAVQEEAVRYKLDGWFMNDEYQMIEVPRCWVPADLVLTLRDEVWDEELLCSVLTMAFIRFMYVSGRADLIGGNWMKEVTLQAAIEKKSVAECITEPAGLPPLLIHGGSAL